jgi:hypothetical protein
MESYGKDRDARFAHEKAKNKRERASRARFAHEKARILSLSLSFSLFLSRSFEGRLFIILFAA